MPRRIEAPYIWDYNPTFFDAISQELFDPEHWSKQNSITGQEQGRGTTYFLRHRGKELVLRHYLRGGLVGKLIHDHYFFLGEKEARSLHEYRVLAHLEQTGLPVPRPVAAQIKRKGLFYQADIIIERIPEAKDLVKVLTTPENNESLDTLFSSIGQMVARFHQHGVYHADLNIKNILIDAKQKLWLIDFDRAQTDCYSLTKHQSSLMRLKRSFEKERLRHQIHFEDDNWRTIEDAYRKALGK